MKLNAKSSAKFLPNRAKPAKPRTEPNRTEISVASYIALALSHHKLEYSSHNEWNFQVIRASLNLSGSLRVSFIIVIIIVRSSALITST